MCSGERSVGLGASNSKSIDLMLSFFHNNRMLRCLPFLMGSFFTKFVEWANSHVEEKNKAASKLRIR
jgi:hypothetical protein